MPEVFGHAKAIMIELTKGKRCRCVTALVRCCVLRGRLGHTICRIQDAPVEKLIARTCRFALSCLLANRQRLTNLYLEPGYAIANLRFGVDRKYGDVNLRTFLRFDNIFDRQYVGSVIVGDGNNRFYEAAPGRTWLAGVSARYTF